MARISRIWVGYAGNTVDAGGPYSGDVSTAIALTGTYATTSNTTPSFLWTIDSSSVGSGTFSDATSLTSTFTPDTQGAYTLVLTMISEGDELWDTATLTSNAAGVTAVPLGHHRLDNQYYAIAASRLNGVLQ